MLGQLYIPSLKQAAMSDKKNSQAKSTPKPEPAPQRHKTAVPHGETHGAVPDRGMYSHEKNEREVEIDEELALTFLTEYHAFEQALVRAGFTRAGRTPGSARPDWARYARHVETQFNHRQPEALQAAVAFLLYNPDHIELREQLLEESFPWETASPLSDVVWLSELIQQTHNQLTLSINFPQQSLTCDTALVLAVLFIMEALANMDSGVVSTLKSVH
jgi:hypothetical protein